MTSPQVLRIESAANATLKSLKTLARESAAYREQGQIWLDGDHLIRAALARGLVPNQVLISEDAMHQSADWRELALRAPRVLVVPTKLFESVSGLPSSTQIGATLAWAPGRALLPDVATVVLDRVQDAGNVGTLLRSAAALGVRQVVALKGCAALGSPKVLRAAMGAHFGLHLVEGASEAELAALQVPLLATSSHADAELHAMDLPHPCAWVFGHEGQGVSASLLARCQTTVSIPQPGGEESLNVAAAAAICLYESLRRQLKA
ncbi:TrmH family RNA methyltransferase [Inhella inkyongensis]|uniref:TrmH family RNA methyltransferase n=1 Tax=Inhella inkyongensis TaxID=392593 RepID=A0A840S4L5_9BURK|nr:RNA methyltransferase [Inhella inkyongensis]MBB5203764.1 TrmH family RNA methyltransferase [Inhella inkyongensis]